MAYSSVLEIFGAIDRGRLDPEGFHNTCSHLVACLEAISNKNVDWFIDIDHVYVESVDEDALFDWVSIFCEVGIANLPNQHTLPWAVRGAILDGSLGLKSTGRGLTTSTNMSVLAELRTSLRSFNGIGVRVGYIPESDSAQRKVFSNVLWTGHSDLPYVLFSDVRPASTEDIGADRLQALTELAMTVASHSRTLSRCYVPAITRIILNNETLDLETTLTVLSNARSVDGIELAGLMLINRAYKSKPWNPSVSGALVSFPRLLSLCKRLQEKHAFPIGLVRKDAIGHYLSEAQWNRPITSDLPDKSESTGRHGRTKKHSV